MISYNNIIDLIKRCDGGIVTIGYDSISEIELQELLYLIKEDLKNEYDIKNNTIESVKDIDKLITKFKIPLNGKKSLIFVNFNDNRLDNYFRLLLNIENVIIIVMKKIYKSSFNTPAFIGGSNQVMYVSTLVFVLTNKNLKIIKNRFGYNDDSININKLIRKSKLEKLEKI